jgi:hypothetical protein
VIHGDLTGNVLLAEDLPPGIIDFSPYYGPVGYAAAVIVVDAIVWFGAPFVLSELIEPADRRNDLLARTLIFRLVAAALNHAASDDHLRFQASAHAPLTAHVIEQLRRAWTRPNAFSRSDRNILSAEPSQYRSLADMASVP